MIGFIIPVIQLGYWSFKTYNKILNQDFYQLIFNSFTVASITAFLTVLLSLGIIYSIRLSGSSFSNYLAKAANIGYAVPGAVIAVGVMIPLLSLDKFLVNFLSTLFDLEVGLIISGSIIMLIFAYVVRFLAVSYNPTEDGFKKIGWNITEVSRTLGSSPMRSLIKINLPLLKTALFSSALLVFVDVMKELPLTLILRPFNFHTLATKAFELASDELIAESANAALVIVITGIFPIIVLSKLISRHSKYESFSH